MTLAPVVSRMLSWLSDGTGIRRAVVEGHFFEADIGIRW